MPRRPGYHRDDEGGALRRLLVAYDGSPGADRALDRVASYAAEGDAVTLINVVPSFNQASALSQHERDANVARRRAQAADARRRLFELGVVATVVIAEGDPAQSICEHAEREGCDAIVVGTRHLHGIQRVGHRSVSGDIVRRAPCDVIIVQ